MCFVRTELGDEDHFWKGKPLEGTGKLAIFGNSSNGRLKIWIADNLALSKAKSLQVMNENWKPFDMGPIHRNRVESVVWHL